MPLSGSLCWTLPVRRACPGGERIGLFGDRRRSPVS